MTNILGYAVTLRILRIIINTEKKTYRIPIHRSAALSNSELIHLLNKQVGISNYTMTPFLPRTIERRETVNFLTSGALAFEVRFAEFQSLVTR
jgi:hypothetical protein